MFILRNPFDEKGKAKYFLNYAPNLFIAFKKNFISVKLCFWGSQFQVPVIGTFYYENIFVNGWKETRDRVWPIFKYLS